VDERRQPARRVALPLRPIHNRDSSDVYGPVVNDLKATLSEGIPTRYENPLSWALIDGSFHRVLDADGRDVHMPNHLRFGTLPTTTLNARTVLVPNTRLQLVVVNSGLLQFCYDYLKFSLKTVVFRDAGEQIAIKYGRDAFENGPRHDVQLITESRSCWKTRLIIESMP
jgi:hypothetical protein